MLHHFSNNTDYFLFLICAYGFFQTLTLLEIVIPLHLLFSIFGEGVSYMKDKTGETEEDSNKLKELEIPRPESHKRGSICKYARIIYKEIFLVPLYRQ